MTPGTIKKLRRLTQGVQSLCLPAAILLLIALARVPGGSFSAYGKPQNAPSFALFRTRCATVYALSEATAQKEADIEERFGVELVRDTGELEPGGLEPGGLEPGGLDPSYRAAPCFDELKLYRALCSVESALAACPEGFPRALGLRLLLCGSIRSSSSAAPDFPAALTSGRGERITLAFDVTGGLEPHTVFHELCHAADRRIAASGFADEFAAGWEALAPPGFRYFGSYTDEKGFPLADTGNPAYTGEAETDPGRIWFLNRYSKTFPEEDRAVLFETLMRAGANSGLFRSPHIIMKLSYYFGSLRSFFDPDGLWPETEWEGRLRALTEN